MDIKKKYFIGNSIYDGVLLGAAYSPHLFN